MKAIEFPEVNVRIAENQPEYETLPVKIDLKDPATPTTMCIELDKEERKQVAETGLIWLTVLTFGQSFHPIKMSCLKPENCTEPASEPDDQLKANMFKHKVINDKGQELVQGKIATGRVVELGEYRKIELEFIQKNNRRPTETEMYEQCLQHEKEWLTTSILMKVPELIRFSGKHSAADEVTIFAEVDVLIPEDSLKPEKNKNE